VKCFERMNAFYEFLGCRNQRKFKIWSDSIEFDKDSS
jgi:hypothetical protein